MTTKRRLNHYQTLPENRGLTYRPRKHLDDIPPLKGRFHFQYFNLQSLQNGDKYSSPASDGGAYCVESLALLAARTEQKTGPIQNRLHHNSPSEQPCAVISKPPRAVGVWRNNVNNCQIRRHSLFVFLIQTTLFARQR